jgi:hypothetical protein
MKRCRLAPSLWTPADLVVGTCSLVWRVVHEANALPAIAADHCTN